MHGWFQLLQQCDVDIYILFKRFRRDFRHTNSLSQISSQVSRPERDLAIVSLAQKAIAVGF